MSWQLASAAVLVLVLAGGLAWYERSKPPARVVSLVATLAALAVVGRLAFAAIPNVKPTTDIVLFAGWALGPAPGFAVGAVTALVSNVFFGQGPWTPWQMTAWGLVGVLGGLLALVWRGREPSRLLLALVCAAAGFGYGGLLDLYQWTLAAQHDVASYVAVSGTSLPYNVAHAVGNFGFAMLIGPAFLRALRRYRRRFDVRWEQPAVVAALMAALVVPALLAAPSAASAASGKQRALAYLERAQNSDGGFGAAPGASSSPLYTGWAALGVAAAGVNPRDVRHAKLTPVSYTRSHAGGLTDVGELERTILLLRAAGLSPHSFGGGDLVTQLQRQRKADGSWEDLVDHTAFAVLALRAAGVSTASVRSAALWLERQQNSDGGFGFGARGGSSDVDDTGSVLQALSAAGRRGSKAVRAAISYLRRAQNADGGFGQQKGQGSNAQSTAWAVQGLLAVGRNPDRMRKSGRTPPHYLASLQTGSGSIRYSRTSAQTPVWVTAEALVALSRRWLPIGPVPRRSHVHVAASPPPAKIPTPPKRPAHRRHAKHARAAKRSKLHGGPIATIAQTTTTAAPKPTPMVHVARARRPVHRGGTSPLPFVLAGVAAALLLAGGYVGRRRHVPAFTSPWKWKKRSSRGARTRPSPPSR